MSQYHTFLTGTSSGPVTVATFSDTEAAPGGYFVQINWGDGTSSTGGVSADPNVAGRFDVVGSHTFARQGMNQVAVTIANISTSSTRTVSSVNPSLIPAPVVTTTPPAGLAVGSTVSDVQVASFFESDLARTATDFTSAITWGDGQVSGGTITADANTPGLFHVTASKPSDYAAAGDLTFKVDVSVLQSGGGYGWRGAAGMPEALGFVKPATAGGLIYQIGGVNGSGQATRGVNAFDPTTNTWTARANLPNQDQVLATATGPDGRIYTLAYDSTSSTDRMDIYNPATDTWTTGNSLGITTTDLQMTTGPNGLIYLVGGTVTGAPSSAAYTYDYTTDSLTAIASLPTARSNVGLATGVDGKIYALGGDVGSATTTDVDVYDPTTNTWTAGTSLLDAQAAMIAGVGPDGMIYSVGGYGPNGWTTNAYAYNMGSGTWAETPGIPSFRLYVGGAVGPDGRIYEMGNAGPSNQVDAFNVIQTFGSNSAPVQVAKGIPTITWANPGAILAGTPLGSAQLDASASVPGTFAYAQATGTVLQAGLGQALSVTFTPDDTANYDPVTATATIDVLGSPVITLTTPTVVVGQAMSGTVVATFTAPTFPGATPSDFAATVTWADNSTTAGVVSADPNVPGQFLVSVSGPSLSTLVGSRSYRVTVDATGQAIPGTWSSAYDFGGQLYYHAAATSGGKVYIIGGYNDDGSTTNVLAYDPATQTITTVAPLPTAIASHAATTGADGKVYVFGGDSSNESYLKTAYVYDPAANTWSAIADMPVGRDYLSAATGPDGKIYALGGYSSSGYVNEVDVYDPATNTWSTVAPLPTAIGYGAAVTGPNGQIYFIGGYGTDGYSSKVFAYNPTTDVWSQVADLPVTDAYLSAAVGPDGRIYAIAGYNDSGYLDTAYAYDAATDTWTQVDSLAAGNYGSAAVTGPDGRVMLIGGSLSTGNSTTIEVLGKPAVPTAAADGALSLIAGPAASFVVTGATDGTVGGLASFVVTAYDAFGNVATGDSGPVQIISSDPNATLPANPTLVSGVGSFTVAFRTAGSQTLRVINPGAPDVAVDQAFSISKAQPVAGPLTTSPGQPTYGQPLVLTAAYTVPGALAGDVVGMVAFYDGDVYLGSAPLVVTDASGSASAQFTVANLAPGGHNFRSAYLGGANSLTADSRATSPVTVAPATTGVTLAATSDGRAVTLTALVSATSPGNPAIAGTVAFYDGETLLGTATIVDGVAILRVGTLPLGPHSFRAVFSGDPTSSASQATIAFNLTEAAINPPPSNPGNPSTPPGPAPLPAPVDVEGPRIIGLSRYGLRLRRTTLALKFDGPLDPATALDRSNYLITRRNGRRIAVRRVTYDEATNTVTLVTARGLRLTRPYTLTVSPRLSDRAGHRLDGAGTGKPGTSFTTKVRWTALSIPGRSPAVTFVDGQAHAFPGRFRQYVRNVLQTTLPRLRKG